MENNGQQQFCQSCGSPLIPGASFCNKCGAKTISRPQQTAQSSSSYAPTQPLRPDEAYNSLFGSSQQSAQSAQAANPYQPNDTYGQPQSAQGVNPYTDSYMASENLAAPKKNTKKHFVIAGVSVLGATAIIVAVAIILNIILNSGGPVTKIVSGAKKLASASSAAISLDISYSEVSINYNICYELDASKKEVVLVMDMSTVYSSSSSSKDSRCVLYCKDGVSKTAYTSSSGYTTYSDIDEDTLDEFFDGLNDINNAGEPDWDTLIEEANLEDEVNADQIEAVSKALIESFDNGEGKEALGITESSVSGGTKYSFDVDLYETAAVAMDIIEPLFKDKSDYNDAKESLEDSTTKSYLNSINLEFDITVDNAGYLSGFDMSCFGVIVDLDITNIGSTSIDLSSSEINSIINGETSSSSYSYYNY